MATSTTSNKGAIVAGDYYFCQTETVPYMFMHNTTNGYTLHGQTGTFASVTDVNFPPNQSPARALAAGAVYLDGYVGVLTTDGRLYNSNSEDPTTWNALNYITKTAEPDGGVAVARHLNYIITFGAWSCEFFYNAGNPTGSPFSRADTATFKVGCAAGSSVVQFEQTVAWVGQSRETGKGVYILNGLSPVKISTTPVEFFLNSSALGSNVRAWVVTFSGHVFYILTLKDINVTFAYDFKEKEWYQWTSTGIGGVETYFTPEFFASVGGVSYLLDGSSGAVSYFSRLYTSDGNFPITYRVVTDPLDFGTNASKFFSSLELIGDRAGANMYIRHSDNDYASFTDYRPVSLLRERPIIYQLGRSRKRVYEVMTRDAAPIRLHSAEFNLEKGTS